MFWSMGCCGGKRFLFAPSRSYGVFFTQSLGLLMFAFHHLSFPMRSLFCKFFAGKVIQVHLDVNDIGKVHQITVM